MAAVFNVSASEYQSEYGKKIKASQNVGVLGNNLAGDEVNFYTGSASFRATDISLPSNGMGLSVSRVYAMENQRQLAAVKGDVYTPEIFSTRKRLFGNWDLDIPHISTTMTQSSGWTVDSSAPLNRCSVVGQTGGSGSTPPGAPPHATVGVWTFSPNSYWSGYTLHAGGEQSMLVASLTNNERPATGGPYHWTTTKDWWISCLSSTANATGEAYVAVAPNGSKYIFNWLSKRNVTSIWDRSELDPDGYGWQKYHYLFRAEYQMLPTRVEDRFGNWTTYAWSSDAFARLTSISTGQVGSTTADQTINFHYNAAGYVEVASFGSAAAGTLRQWTYTYYQDVLDSVTAPDGSKWQYDLSGLDHIEAQSPSCEWAAGTTQWWEFCFGNEVDAPLVSAAITHPSGAEVAFVFDDHFQYAPGGTGSYPMGLVSKTISGPGLTPATWKYAYLVADYKAQCQANNCPTKIMTDELGPDGSLRRKLFGIVPNQDETLLLGELIGTTASNAGGGSPAITSSVRWGTDPLDDLSPTSGTVPTFYQELDYRYIPAGQAAAYVVRVGANPMVSFWEPAGQIYSSERRLPVVTTNQHLQGVLFKSEIPQTCSGLHCFTAYGQPTRRVMSSTGGTGGNFSRTELTAYLNQATKWVIGQVSSVTCTGGTDCTPDKIVSRTDYDATRLLPWRTYSFEVLQATLTYNANGTLATATDGRGNTTTLATWELGVPKDINFPGGASIHAELWPHGLIKATRDELNSRTCYDYDLVGRLTAITYTSEAAANACATPATSGTWNPLGRTFLNVPTAAYGLPTNHWEQTVTTGNAKTTTYYDVQWRPVLTRTEDTANTNTRSFVVTRYDGLGRQTFKSYPVAALTAVNDTLKGTRTTYDGLGRVVQVQQDSENVGGQTVLNTNTSYISGFRTQLTNPRGKVSTTAYQAYDTPTTDAPVSILHPASVVTTIARQPSLGKPLSVTRSGPYGGTLSATRSYVYDSNERPCKTINPESNSTLVDYDLAGNVSWSADGMVLPSLTCDRGSVPVGDRTTRTYDTMNRVTAIDTPGGTADVDTTYHADGLVDQLTAANPGGYTVTSTYRYNKRRLLTEEYANNSGIVLGLGYAYNANAHLTNLSYPDGQAVVYSVDALGRTTQVASSGGQVYASGIGYHPTGAISGFTYGNQIVHAMTPNVRQLPGRSWDVYSSTTFLDDSYVYDANGNVDAITDALPVSATSHTRDLGYDDLDRLIVADAPNAVWGNATYSYDPLDNLRTVTIANQNGTTRSHFYNYNTPTNQLSSITGPTGHGAYGFAYDARGNTTWKNVATGNCASYPVMQCAGKVPQTFVFDRANRLSQVTGVQTYRYDGLGRRVQTTDADGKTTFWMYSQAGQVLYSSEARRSQNIGYIYLGNTQVATRSVAWGAGVATVRYQHTDALGSPVVETDAARNVIKRNVFSPWGEAWGTTVVDGTGYTGHVMDQGTGLTYMQQRYYDPTIGRFLSVDPVTADGETGANFNRFWYADNNPYRLIDPDGRTAESADGFCSVSGCNSSYTAGESGSEAKEDEQTEEEALYRKTFVAPVQVTGERIGDGMSKTGDVVEEGYLYAVTGAFARAATGALASFRAWRSMSKIISSAGRPSRVGSEESRALQALRKRVDNHDSAFAGLVKTEDQAATLLRQILKADSKMVTERFVDGRLQRQVFDRSTRRGVRTLDGEFVTFVNMP